MRVRLRSLLIVAVAIYSLICPVTAESAPWSEASAPQAASPQAVTPQTPAAPDPAPPATPSSEDASAVQATAAPEPQKTLEVDQTIVNLPTTMPLKRHHGYFRLTHRFARDLGRGDLSELAQDLFGLDEGAIIGLEFRFALTSQLQAGVHRSILGKTIVAFGRWDWLRQSDHLPISLSVGASIEGQNNLRQDPQPGLSATVSYVHGTWLALYATPTYVHNAHTATLLLEHEGHTHEAGEEDTDSTARDTWYLGLGTRVRIRETVALVAEVAPRFAGYQPDQATWNVGIEKMTRGHVLQLNFGNNFDTTPGMIARGGNPGQVYLGFNLSRKF